MDTSKHKLDIYIRPLDIYFSVSNDKKGIKEAINQIKLDAELIAYYGEAIKPRLSQLKPENIRMMSDLLSRRRQLTTMQTMEKNRLQIMPNNLLSLIKPILTTIKNQIEKVDRKLLKLIEDCPEYHAKNDILQSVPGIGNVVAFSLLADMLELGNISSKQVATLVGVAPFNRESGSYKGRPLSSAYCHVYGHDVSNTM